MKDHDARMVRIEKLLAQMDKQRAEMVKIGNRIAQLRHKIEREVVAATHSSKAKGPAVRSARAKPKSERSKRRTQTKEGR